MGKPQSLIGKPTINHPFSVANDVSLPEANPLVDVDSIGFTTFIPPIMLVGQ
jgi:hypothetical protein